MLERRGQRLFSPKCVHKVRVSREEDYCRAYVQLYHSTSGPYITRFRRGFCDFAFPDFVPYQPGPAPSVTHISVIRSQGNVREAGSKNISPKCVHKVRVSREEDYCGAYVQLYHPTSGPYITRFRRGFCDFAFLDFGSLPAESRTRCDPQFSDSKSGKCYRGWVKEYFPQDVFTS